MELRFDIFSPVRITKISYRTVLPALFSTEISIWWWNHMLLRHVLYWISFNFFNWCVWFFFIWLATLFNVVLPTCDRQKILIFCALDRKILYTHKQIHYRAWKCLYMALRFLLTKCCCPLSLWAGPIYYEIMRKRQVSTWTSTSSRNFSKMIGMHNNACWWIDHA